MNKKLKIPAYVRETIRISLHLFILPMLCYGMTYADNSKGQNVLNKSITVHAEGLNFKRMLSLIENQAGVQFVYSSSNIDTWQSVSLNVSNEKLGAVLKELLHPLSVEFSVTENRILLKKRIVKIQDHKGESNIVNERSNETNKEIKGSVSDENGEPLSGVNILIKGTQQGTITGLDGTFNIVIPDEDAVLIFSFVGYVRQEVNVGNRNLIAVTLKVDEKALDEVVVVGYGSMRRRDLTGAIGRANLEAFDDMPNVSIMQSLQGTVAGLNIGQVSRSGQEPSYSIRGRTSISGTQTPLIVLDGVIYRGNLIDINPDDIEAIDVLKDNSATAVYGSQAANGVLLITSKSGKRKDMKPTITYSGSYAFQSPTLKLEPGTPEDFMKKNQESDILLSRTPESGYREPNPNYSPTFRFRTNEQIQNYTEGRYTDWYNLLTNKDIYINNHNLSLAAQTEYLNYFISVGATDDKGYMVNEKYKRYNARINVDSRVNKWLTIGVQTFATVSDYSGLTINPTNRYRHPYDVAYDTEGHLIDIPGGTNINSLLNLEGENENIRTNLFGNIYATVNFPFLKGLSYKINFFNNYRTTNNSTFEPWEQGFTGSASKNHNNALDMSSDNILSYKGDIGNVHNYDVTLVYGFEKRKFSDTYASSAEFVSPVLGYNRLQAGASSLQRTESAAWNEASLYNMARLFYGYKQKYLLTGTIRRDGFSGFSENNKFGFFPSIAFGWVASEESFFKSFSDIIDYLKIRVSYGSSGNRTISRYQTLARVSSAFGYIDAAGNPVYTQEISSLASPNLKWETTTGLNVGIDFGVLKSRISGSVEYYNNETTNLLYNVDIPGISRYQEFPDNLGRIHNYGIETTLSSVNITNKNFTWSSDVVFSLNRDQLKELLGFDNDGDGKEDDLVSSGLFIGKPLSVNYHYDITGQLYQVGDDIPSWADMGTHQIIDQNQDGRIDPSDYVILGYRLPSYRVSVHNQLRYKNWSLNIFVNSIQGGKNHYYASDELLLEDFGGDGWNNPNDVQQFSLNFPKGLDYWTPENPNARYQRITAILPPGARASRWIQRNFIRLQDVSLGYQFNSALLEKVQIKRMKVFITGKNLLTLTKWPGWDPETGERITRSGRPVLKSYSIGLNLEL